MEKEKFEKMKAEFEELREKELYERVGKIWAVVSCFEDITREEINELMDILFIPKV